jgi:hypothetical protein
MAWDRTKKNLWTSGSDGVVKCFSLEPRGSGNGQMSLRRSTSNMAGLCLSLSVLSITLCQISQEKVVSSHMYVCVYVCMYQS